MKKPEIVAFALLALVTFGCKKASTDAAIVEVPPCQNVGEYPAIGKLHMTSPGRGWIPIEQPFCTSLTQAYQAVGYCHESTQSCMTLYHRPYGVDEKEWTPSEYAEQLRKAYVERDRTPLGFDIGHCSEVRQRATVAAFYCRTAFDDNSEFEAGVFAFARMEGLPGLLMLETTIPRGVADDFDAAVAAQQGALATVTAQSLPPR